MKKRDLGALLLVMGAALGGDTSAALLLHDEVGTEGSRTGWVSVEAETDDSSGDGTSASLQVHRNRAVLSAEVVPLDPGGYRGPGSRSFASRGPPAHRSVE